MRLTIALIASLFISNAAFAQDEAQGHPFPAFTSTISVDSPLYDGAISKTGSVEEFEFDGLIQNMVANIPVDNCGVIRSNISTKMVPNIIDAGMSAHIEITIENEMTDANSTCQNEAMAIIPPIKVDVPIEIGNSNLMVRHPQMHHVEYSIDVSYLPVGVKAPKI